jgi:hypothetical protein
LIDGVAREDPPLARRMAILRILREESYLTRAQ